MKMVEIGSAKLLNVIGFMLLVGGLLLLYKICRDCGVKKLTLVLLFGLTLTGLFMLEFYSFPLIRAEYIGKPLTKDDLKDNQEYEVIISFFDYTRVGFRQGNNVEVRDIIGLPKMPNGTKFFIFNGKICWGDPAPKLIPQVAF